MSRGSLTTTSYAVLGLLSIKPWSSYELTQQMDRSLGRIWPRAMSKLYEEPKKLVEPRLGPPCDRAERAAQPHHLHDHRQGTARPGQLVARARRGASARVRADIEGVLRRKRQQGDTLESAQRCPAWAQARCAESLAVGEQYPEGEGPFPERLPELQLASRFVTDFYLLVLDWAAGQAASSRTGPMTLAKPNTTPR